MSGAAQGYIGRNPGDSQVTIARQQFTPTGVTTDFTFASGYTAGYVDVYINGAKILVGRDYTATNGSVVGLTSAAQNGDIVEIVAYKAFNVNNVAASNGNFTVGGILTVDDNTALSGQLEVTGVSTFAGAVENVVSTGIVTALGFSGNITGAAATFTGDVSIGGTLTYEDVTNIDSVGIVTARAGVNVSGGQLQVGVAYSVGNAGVATAAGFVGPLTGDVTGNLTGNQSGGSISATSGTFSSNVYITDQLVHTGDEDTQIRFPSNNTFSVETGGSEALRVDSSQRLVIGATSSNNVGGFGGAALQVEGLNAATSAMSLIRHSNDAVSPSILMGKSRGTSDGANTIVQDDDVVARIIAYGADGTDTESSLGAIQFDVDGTPGANDMPGRIVFSTTPDGAATYTERLRITSDGQIGVNKSSPKAWNASYTSLQIHDAGYIAGSTDDSFVALGANNYLDTGGTYDYTNSDFASQLYQVDGTLVFRNAPSGTADNAITWTNRLSINVSGNATFAGTVSDSKGDLRRVIENEPGGGAYQIVAADAGKFIHHNNTIKMPDSGTLSIGDMVTIYAYGALTLDVTKPGGGEATVYNAADASTGDRTFAARSIATILCVAADTYVISGSGIS